MLTCPDERAPDQWAQRSIAGELPENELLFCADGQLPDSEEEECGSAGPSAAASATAHSKTHRRWVLCEKQQQELHLQTVPAALPAPGAHRSL